MTTEPTPHAFLPLSGPVAHGTFRRRYKRFFADIKLDEHGEVTAHTPNTGAMTGLTDEGAPVLVTHHDDPKRRLQWSLEEVHTGTSWVCTNTYLANRLIKLAIEHGQIPDFEGYTLVQPERAFPDGGRVDLFLSGHPTAPDAWVEIKSVTLREGDRATWPDAVSERGRRHLASLRERLAAGERAAMVFLIQRTDVEAFGPAADVDPAYAAALYDAFEAGVDIVPLEAIVDERGLHIGRRLPIEFTRDSGWGRIVWPPQELV